mmetsp:Transcript_17393/g.15343  ORF Transcript_17393/g.15343 Transcript_17393/m.15343 type:complete len:101 (-) Transcript_17393:16-318(-)
MGIENYDTYDINNGDMVWYFECTSSCDILLPPSTGPTEIEITQVGGGVTETAKWIGIGIGVTVGVTLGTVAALSFAGVASPKPTFFGSRTKSFSKNRGFQ